MGRAEEWRHCPQADWLRSAAGAYSNRGVAPCLRGFAMVHKLLPAVVQTQIQTSPRSASSQNLLSAGDPVCKIADASGRTVRDQGDAKATDGIAGPCDAAEAHPRCAGQRDGPQ